MEQIRLNKINILCAFIRVMQGVFVFLQKNTINFFCKADKPFITTNVMREKIDFFANDLLIYWYLVIYIKYLCPIKMMYI